MSVFIGAEHIISPIGVGAELNFNKAFKGFSGVAKIEKAGFRDEVLFMSSFQNSDHIPTIFELIKQLIDELVVAPEVIESDKTKVIVSSTKGDISNGVQGALQRIVTFIQNTYALVHQPTLISNACISGVQAINLAADYIDSGSFKHVIVIGCDVLSTFVINGFQSLYAISEAPCQPYDEQRTGINLGEACAAVVLSNDNNIYKGKPLQYLGGSTTNDANHISGPSRTGEGLYRSVKQSLERAKIDSNSIGYISAHGTATRFNDDMESIAFNRLGMNLVPLNSLKGYFGHTLGTAGIIETAMAMQSLKQQKLLKSRGCENKGTTEPISVIQESTNHSFDVLLKTASGFGGGNASLILSR